MVKSCSASPMKGEENTLHSTRRVVRLLVEKSELEGYMLSRWLYESPRRWAAPSRVSFVEEKSGIPSKDPCATPRRADLRLTAKIYLLVFSLSPRLRSGFLSSQIHLVLAGGGETGVKSNPPSSLLLLPLYGREKTVVRSKTPPTRLVSSAETHGAFKLH